MKIENIMKMLEVFWPIAIAIYGFFIYKFIPYMKTKIFINEYHNNEYFFALSVIGLIYSFGISLIVKLKKKTKKEICRQYVFWNSGLLCNFNARFSNLKKFI